MRIFEITKSEAVAQTVEDFAKAGGLAVTAREWLGAASLRLQ
jgi:hypothetical protein